MTNEPEWDNCTKCGNSAPLDGVGVCIDCANSDLTTRLNDVLNTRLRVEAAAVLEVLTTWLADNELAIVDNALNVVEL